MDSINTWIENFFDDHPVIHHIYVMPFTIALMTFPIWIWDFLGFLFEIIGILLQN